MKGELVGICCLECSHSEQQIVAYQKEKFLFHSEVSTFCSRLLLYFQTLWLHTTPNQVESHSHFQMNWANSPKSMHTVELVTWEENNQKKERWEFEKRPLFKWNYCNLNLFITSVTALTKPTSFKCKQLNIQHKSKKYEHYAHLKSKCTFNFARDLKCVYIMFL